MSEFDLPWDNDLTVTDVDRYYTTLRDGHPSLNGSNFPGLRAPSKLKMPSADRFEHAFAGILIYVIEAGLILLQRRDNATDKNPRRLCIFGGKIIPHELPSAGAVRELVEETGIPATADKLLPQRAYIENRTPTPVFRAIFLLLLDRFPSPLFVGEGAAIEAVRITQLDEIDDLTWLSREDINTFLDNFHLGRAA
jgi:8-oxo-dGTP pyrophosphatase MutT (NUDIX family)